MPTPPTPPTPLTQDQIDAALQGLDGWRHADDKLRRDYQTKDFSEALSFIVRVGLLAEQQGHHPELFNVYNRVEFALATHDAGDKVTQKDIDLATAIDGVTKGWLD